MKYHYIIVAAFLLLSSCARISQIEKADESESHFKNVVYKGKDFYQSDEEVFGEKYRIFHQASTGFSGTSGIRRSAVDRANKFCQDLDHDKKMITLSEHTADPPYILGNFPRIEIIFACVDKDNKDIGKVELDKYDSLRKAKELLESGALTEKEFKIEKDKILNQ
jgi:hypothetical protein